MTRHPALDRLNTALAAGLGLPVEDALFSVTLAALAASDRNLLEAALLLARERSIPRAQIEELLLQGVLFGGFPRTVDAFHMLRIIWGAEVLPPQPTSRHTKSEGAELFDRIYAELAARVRAELIALHPDLAQWIAAFAYGEVLARPALSARQRELAAVTALAASRCRRQLLSHARGAVRCGATSSEVRAALALAALLVPEIEIEELAPFVDRALQAVDPNAKTDSP